MSRNSDIKIKNHLKAMSKTQEQKSLDLFKDYQEGALDIEIKIRGKVYQTPALYIDNKLIFRFNTGNVTYPVELVHHDSIKPLRQVFTLKEVIETQE